MMNVLASAVIRRFLVLTGMLMLSACAADVVRTVTEFSPIYSHDDFVYSTAGRDTRVIVRGNLFKMEQGQFERAVAAAMQGQNLGPDIHFTTTPGPTAHKDFKVVILFNGPGNIMAYQLCESPRRYSSVAQDAGVTVLAAWCYGDEPETEVIAATGPVAGPQSPHFRSLIAQLTMALFPLRKTDDDDGDDDHWRLR